MPSPTGKLAVRGKVRESVLGPESVHREALQLPGSHLVLAAEPLAQNNLGLMYAEGRGGRADDALQGPQLVPTRRQAGARRRAECSAYRAAVPRRGRRPGTERRRFLRAIFDATATCA